MKSKKEQRTQLLIYFSYNGKRFHGVQPNGELPTVGLALKKRLENIAGCPAKALNFTARTDAGVSALENAATCWFKAPFAAAEFLQNFNDYNIDDGLLNVKATQVHYKVHARNISVGKYYKYTICDGSNKNYFDDDNKWHIMPTLNIAAMQEACDLLVGEHDFSSFRAKGCSAGTTIKNLFVVKIDEPIKTEDGYRLINIHIKGNSFLRKMIRILVGTLAEIGAGFREPKDIQTIIAQKNRQKAGITAPACGLCLVKLL